MARTIAEAVATGEPYSSRHRIIDRAGEVHHVIVVGDRLLDDDGAVVGTTGYYVDVTGSFEERLQETLDETIPDIIAARAVIEQAKGVLMLVYGVNAEQAFRVLQWRSQETNIKLCDLSGRLVAAAIDMDGGPTRLRIRFDRLLLGPERASNQRHYVMNSTMSPGCVAPHRVSGRVCSNVASRRTRIRRLRLDDERSVQPRAFWVVVAVPAEGSPEFVGVLADGVHLAV